MMNYPLVIPRILERANTFFPRKEIITREEQGIHRYTYRDFTGRVARLSNALRGLGIKEGDRVATFAWNTYRHLEAYYAVPVMGAVIHTVNIRLADDDIVYIINHAADKVIIVDVDLLPTLEELAPRLDSVEHFIVMTDNRDLSTTLPSALNYEELLSNALDEYLPAEIEEDAPAGLCFTSATTGRPKGVTYSHRGIVLHTMMQCQADTMGFRERDVVLAMVPMFHANCWGVPYSAALVGANQVLPGVRPDPQVVCQLIEDHRVTLALGVPTIWVGLMEHLERTGRRPDFSSLREVLSGGSAVPVSLIQAYKDKFHVDMVHAYGMTEATPIVVYNRSTSVLDALSDEERLLASGKQGMLVPGLEVRLVDEEGRDLPWDGEARGELYFKGPWIANEYYDDPRGEETFVDGWYHSGDIASIDEYGYIQIGDRVKDMVKSGGEWISSVDLENAIIAHPGVLEAAVIAVPHPTWQERPLACVVPNVEYRETLGKAEILDYLRRRFVPWWVPDDVVFLDAIPKTSVGKFDKKVLREQFQERQTDG